MSSIPKTPKEGPTSGSAQSEPAGHADEHASPKRSAQAEPAGHAEEHASPKRSAQSESADPTSSRSSAQGNQDFQFKCEY